MKSSLGRKSGGKNVEKFIKFPLEKQMEQFCCILLCGSAHNFFLVIHVSNNSTQQSVSPE